MEHLVFAQIFGVFLQRWPVQSRAGQHGRRRDVLQQGETYSQRTHAQQDKSILTPSFVLQKRTWDSNKNDIRVCRMKGKHEVKSDTRGLTHHSQTFTSIFHMDKNHHTHG